MCESTLMDSTDPSRLLIHWVQYLKTIKAFGVYSLTIFLKKYETVKKEWTLIILQQIVFKTLLVRQVMVYGVRLPVSDTGNFLGWTWDQKLTWNAHLTASFIRRDGRSWRSGASSVQTGKWSLTWLNGYIYVGGGGSSSDSIRSYSLVVQSYSDSAASSRVQSILYITWTLSGNPSVTLEVILNLAHL